MLDRDARTAILELHRRGRGSRRIADDLGVSRTTVRKVIEDGDSERPEFQREELLEQALGRVRDLDVICQGNLVRVHEILAEEGVEVAYSTLTAFCRRHGIGVPEKKPAGEYTFGPGEEMQHDTSPHDVVVGGRERRLQCASLVMAYSRARFIQIYPKFDRFFCKSFLSDAALYFQGMADRCMVDNTSVVVAHGTGRDAVFAPEVVAFGERFGFHFEAHEKGDANRSARVERPFDHIERNFYPGRTFADLTDLNTQARAWCDKINAKLHKTLHATPFELLAAERYLLHPLPAWVPEVVRVETRIVDTLASVNLHTNRYDVPVALIGEQVEVQERLTCVRVLHRHRLVVEHPWLEPGAGLRAKLDGQERRPSRRKTPPPLPEETVLCAAGPEFVAMVEALRRRPASSAHVAIRRLHRMFLDYPTEHLRLALAQALAYGLHDVARVERMVLRQVAGEFFRLPVPQDPEVNP
jgi:transposase